MKSKKIQRNVTIALLMTMVVVLQFVSASLPKLGMFSLSLVLIPVVLGAALYGPGAGSILGSTFGVIVFINCVTGMDPGGAMVFQADPLLCFLVVMAKGILAGFSAGVVHRSLKRWPYLATLAAAIVCPVINTGTFIICMLLFFMEVLNTWAGGTDLVGYILTGLILANFLPELIINVVFSPAGQRIVRVTQMK